MTALGAMLPFADSWEEAETFFSLLTNVRSLQEFGELISARDREDRSHSSWLRARLERYAGLLVFLERYCSDEDRAAFFDRTLPFIAKAAARFKERVPESGVPLLRRHENASLVLGRQLVLSLLANAFLCTFPDHQPATQQQQGDQEEDGEEVDGENMYPFTFFGLYDQLQKSTKNTTAIAAKLKCILVYFHRLADDKYDLSGVITIKRQVLPPSEVPSLDVWGASPHPLCGVSVDSSRGIEDSGSHTLQVDFANRHVSGGTLEGGCLQEEIRFSLSPELLVARLVLEPLEDNEAAIITGAERFADYGGYGESLQYNGEHTEQSFRDMFGNILTSVVAIDAVPFTNRLSPDDQYTDHYLLRELNKAFTGFLCQHDRGDVTTELIALRVQNDATQLVLSENYPPPPLPLSPDACNTVGVAAVKTATTVSLPPETAQGFVRDSASVGSSGPAQTRVEETSKMTQLPQIASPDTSKRPPTAESKVTEYADNLSGFILSSVFSKAPVLETPNASVETVAEKVTTSILGDLSIKPNEDVGKKSLSSTADVLARGIISDVLSQDRTVPANTPPLSPQTMGQPTSPGNEWRIHSYADRVADNIIASVLGDIAAPPCALKRASAPSSRSSSLTGQTITLHEFTDDLVEGAVREGVLIATLQSRRGAERANVVEVVVEGESGETGEGVREGGGGKSGEGLKGVHRSASELADYLVTESIQRVLDDSRQKGGKTTDNGGRDKAQPYLSSGNRMVRRAESPLHLSGKTGLLRQTLEKPKLLASMSIETEMSDMEQSTPGAMLHLTAPSSRMSYAWSVASTRDEGSRPVSPTDLDRMALSFVGSLDEFCTVFAELVIRTAIADVTGNKEYRYHVPIKAHPPSEGSLYMVGDVRMQVPVLYHDKEEEAGRAATDGPQMRLDTFLSTLDEAEPLGGGEMGESGEKREECSEKSPAIHKALLRPVATGNWGCGAFGGDPQLKSMLQWMAVSAAGRAEMIYFPFSDKRMEQLPQVTSHLHAKQWTVGQLLSTVVNYCRLSKEDRQRQTLFSLLLEQ